MNQPDLFSTSTREQRIGLEGFGELRYFPAWLAADVANGYFSCLFKETPWRQPEIFVYGQSRVIPRKQAWYGDPDARMTYSGTHFDPMPWHPILSKIRQRLEAEFDQKFNSVLVNLYRDGNDSVSWHADDEAELGTNPVIASVSLGAQRKFSLKPKSSRLPNAGMPSVYLRLNHGDLVIMSGSTQKYWQHAVLKDKKVLHSRINLTFRRIRSGPRPKTPR